MDLTRIGTASMGGVVGPFDEPPDWKMHNKGIKAKFRIEVEHVESDVFGADPIEVPHKIVEISIAGDPSTVSCQPVTDEIRQRFADDCAPRRREEEAEM